jgi:hypothetical protein
MMQARNLADRADQAQAIEQAIEQALGQAFGAGSWNGQASKAQALGSTNGP